jgi:hypothetical protein
MGGVERRVEMTTIPHETPVVARPWWLEARDMWTSLAITVMWLAVLFDSLFGPDIYNADAGGNISRVPSGVALAFFALFATIAVAKYGFSKKTKEN